MYKLKVISFFSAGHSLRGYRGKCEALHGHNWKVEITVNSTKLDPLGMVKDFKDLKGIVHKVLEDLDHRYLNDLDYFKRHNPSSEEIARYIFLRLKEEIRPWRLRIREVCVWETETSCACYLEER